MDSVVGLNATAAGVDTGDGGGGSEGSDVVATSAVYVYCRHCCQPIRRRRRIRRGEANNRVGAGRLPTRGLCQRCYNDPAVRPRYPLVGGSGGVGGCGGVDGVGGSGGASRGVRLDNRATLPLPPTPTDAMPGSDKKLEVLEERAKQGYSLWHPDDLTVDAQMLQEFGFTLAGLVQAGGDRSTRTRCLEVLGPTAGLNLRPRKELPEGGVERAEALADSKARSRQWAAGKPTGDAVE